MTLSFLASSRARALLIGCGHYDSPEWPDIKSASPTMDRFGALLRDRCGMRPHAISVLRDPGRPEDVIDAVDLAARDATDDVLLFYIIGHATTGVDGGLRLITTESNGLDASPVKANYTQIRFQDVLEAAAATGQPRPRTVVAILDCCGAGRVASNDFGRFQSHYLIAAVGPDQLAMAPPDQLYTTFGGQIIRLLEQGDPEFGESIRLDAFADKLRRTVRPQPVVTGTAYFLELASNPHPGAFPKPSRVAGSSAAPTGKCPYPGLIGFSERERGWFRGRERAIEEVVIPLTAIDAPALPYVVSGPSGAGKSSFIRAGVLPVLKEHARDYATRFQVVIVPEPDTSRLLRALARQLTNAFEQATLERAVTAPTSGELEQRLRGGLPSAQVAMEEIMKATAGMGAEAQELLIVIDQVEKVFAHDVNPAERATFVSALCDLAQAGLSSAPALRPGSQDRAHRRVRVLLGVQSEYTTLLADADDRLRKALTGNHYMLAPLDEAEVRRAIVEPAAMEGIAPEPDMVSLLWADFAAATKAVHADSTGNLQPPRLLPHLAEALRTTFGYSPDGHLTLEAYRQSGRLDGAIAKTADRCFRELKEDGLGEITRQLLLCLVQYEGEHHYEIKTVRHRALFGDLSAEADEDKCEQVLGKLRKYSLVTEGSTGVALVHQVLLSAWPLMADWLQEDEAWQTIRERIQNGANDWEAEGKQLPDDIMGLPLADDFAAATQRRAQNSLRPKDWDYLKAGLDKQHDLGRRKRWARWTMRSIVVLAGVALVGLVAAMAYARHEQQSATQQQADSTAARLASAADAMRLNSPLLAARLAVAAYRSAPTLEAWSALLQTAAQAGPTAVSSADISQLSGIQVSVSDSLIATPGASGQIAVDKVSGGRRAMTLPNSQGYVTDLVFDHDGSLLAGTNQAGSVRIWNMQAAQATPRDIDFTSADTANVSVSSVTFSADDKLVAVAYSVSNTNTAEIWQLEPDSPLAHLVSLPGSFAEFTGNGDELAIMNSGENWHLQSIDATTGLSPVEVFLPQLRKADPEDVCFSPRGNLLVDSSPGPPDTTTVWVANGTSARPISSIPGSLNDSGACVFSPDGTVLVLSGEGIWDMAQPDHPSLTTVLPASASDGQPIVGTAQFSADHLLLAVPGDPAHVWDISGLRQPDLTAEIPSAAAGQAPVAADSRRSLIATGAASGAVTVWAMASHHSPTRWGVVAPPTRGPIAGQPVTALSFDSGQLTITYGSVGTSTWDVSTRSFARKSVKVLTPILDPAELLSARSPYRDLVASGDGAAVNFSTGSADNPPDLTVVPQPGATVTALAFSQDGDVLAVGNDQGEVLLLMLQAHTAPVAVAALPTRPGAITGIAFGPDDTLIVAAKDGVTLVSSLSPAALINQACATPVTPQVTSKWSLYASGVPSTACAGI